MAGEHSTTEPPMLLIQWSLLLAQIFHVREEQTNFFAILKKISLPCGESNPGRGGESAES